MIAYLPYVLAAILILAPLLYLLSPRVSLFAVCLFSGLLLPAYGIIRIAGYINAQTETLPAGKLLPRPSLPIMFSMLKQALRSIVDSMSTARSGEKALTSISLAYPM